MLGHNLYTKKASRAGKSVKMGEGSKVEKCRGNGKHTRFCRGQNCVFLPGNQHEIPQELKNHVFLPLQTIKACLCKLISELGDGLPRHLKTQRLCKGYATVLYGFQFFGSGTCHPGLILSAVAAKTLAVFCFKVISTYTVSTISSDETCRTTLKLGKPRSLG